MKKIGLTVRRENEGFFVRERYLKYFDEATVDKYILDIQNYLTGREISLKSNAVFINATK